MLKAKNAELTLRNESLEDRNTFLEKCLNDLQNTKAFEFIDALPEKFTTTSEFDMLEFPDGESWEDFDEFLTANANSSELS